MKDIYEETFMKELMKNNKYEFLSKNSELLVGEKIKDFIKYYNTTDMQLAMEYMYIQSEISDKIFDNISEGIVITDENAIIQWANLAFTEITGYTIQEAKGKKTSLLKSDSHEPKFYDSMWKSLINEGFWEGEIWNRRKNGEAYLEILKIKSIKNDNNKIIKYIAIFTDITNIKSSKNNYKVNYDPLTGLPNRLLLNERLKIAIEYAKSHNTKLSILFLDLDDFKKVNDGLGFEIGDMLLKEVSARLKILMHDRDIVARIGADEFIILKYDVGSKLDLTNIASKLLNVFSNKFVIKGHDIYISVSIGISVYPKDGEDADSLVKNSNLAMYQSKKKIGNKYEVYGLLVDENATKKIKLENDLRKALENNEFEVYYQPKINLLTMKIMGVEALIRWRHPVKGIISPVKFIPLAEKNGLIEPIGDWVLETACKQSIEWQIQGYEPLIMSVNISAVQFRSRHLVKTVNRVLKLTGLKPQLLDLEITETTAMESMEHTVKIMNELKDIGVYLSLDDFGTGYSSLGYLKKFPYDYLKIDKSFVDDITKTDNDLNLVKSIVAMAHSLDMKVVAEGAETKEQVVCLNEVKCDQLQGYYFYPPLNANGIREILDYEE
ncbi:putative bifunctional diguanylate cyclase/phosphodiesterase [Abyssisolibacter fermentans]|uniref:putative bifunctional diguanylate cyclase/phosphodiesterase n=1 Tax=Abyssisolibacter fermentans TaxID=1766203 RepID=UPI00083716B9|nr:EAL domain-containing protein [Abyssisolibacter fermentans]